MTHEEATKIKTEYAKYDEAFRAAKKAQKFAKASEYKAKRDALYAKFIEACKVA